MSDFEPKGPKRSFDIGYVRARVPERESRERTPEQKAADAKTIADNLGRQCKLVRDSVAAIAIAAAAEDRADWTLAKQAADAGVAQIHDTVKVALAAAPFATDAEVRACLAGVEQLLTDAKALVASARGAPEIRAPVMTCADALLAVLPPLSSPPGPVEPVYAAAEHAVKTIFGNQMTRSDISAFEAILGEHKDHKIARRFRRFGSERQNRLLGILAKDKVQAAARAREAAQQKLRRDATAHETASAGVLASEKNLTPAEPTPASSVAANIRASTDRRVPTTKLFLSASGDTVAAMTATPVHRPVHRPVAPEPKEPLGAAITARVPGVTYQGSGRFRVAARGRSLDVTTELIPARAGVLHRTRDAVVLAIPRGLGEAELVQTVAEQLRVLHDQLSAEGAGTTEDIGFLAGAGTAAAPVTAAPSATVQLAPVAPQATAPVGPQATAPVAPQASAPHAEAPPVTAEPEIRALLSQAIAEHDIPRLQQRKAALLSLFQAIPTAERDHLRARLHDKKDALGQLFQLALSTKLRMQLLAVLDGAVIRASLGADSVDMATFATTVQPARFYVAGEVVLDDAWRTSQKVQLRAVPSFGPPAEEPGPLVHWRLVDRMGERRSSGMVTWAPAAAAPPAIEVTLDQPGRWNVAIEIVDRGKVIAAIEKPILARAAAETGDDLPALLGGNDLARSAEAMSDQQVGDQLGLLRAQMGKHSLGSLKPDAPMHQKLAHAVEELQWQQHQRGLTPASEPDPDFEARSFDASDPGRRASIQRGIDELIARYGLDGAKAQLHDLIVPPPGTGQGAGAEPASWDPHAAEIERILHAELELRRTEAASFLHSFEHQGRAIALGLLAESEARLRAELARYGLKRGSAQDGSYGNQGPASTDVSALRDAVEQGRQIRAAYDRMNQAVHDRATSGTEAAVLQARKEFEATKLIAIAKHPMLKLFLDGETRQAAWAPTGSVPGPLDLGSYEAGHFGMYMGWELNKKLSDLHATRRNITDGTLSIFGVPKVVELVKANLHVAPGSVHDGMVNERTAHAHDGNDDSGVLALFTLALGLLLAVPSGGTSLVGAGIATAGEVTLLAADLYLLGKDFEQRNLYHAATNTDLSVADALLQEEPEAGPLILRLLGVVGPLAGAGGVAKRVGEVAHVARAREGIEAVRAIRRAAEAADQVMTDPRVVAAVERLRPIAREAGMTDAELSALVRNIGRKGIGSAAHAATSTADAAATVTKDMAPQLARRLGVDEIEISGIAGEVGVHPTMRNGRVVAGKVVVGPSATVGDVMAHKATVEMIERYNGLAGKVRETWDQIAEAVTGAGRANPHAVFTGAHEAFAEVRKYEAMIRGRMADLVSQLGHGGAAGAAAASRIENEILVMEGELSHWRGVLEDVKGTGDPRLARGLIEAKDIGKVTDEAVAAGYPVLPSNQYRYRRWPEGGPEGQEFQVIRADASGPDPLLQPRRRGNGWVLEETEGTGKVPKAFAAALSDGQVLAGMFVESQSLRAYHTALTDRHGIALDTSAVQVRMRKVIERVRTPRGATADQVAAGARRVIDEDNLRHALKAEFREAFFACAAREATPEARLAKFRDITKDLNPADRGNLVEDFLARRDPGSVQQVAVKQADHPHLGLTAQERHIDRVSADGTAVEVKSIKGKLSTDDLAQLEDYRKMITAKDKISVLVAGKPTKIERAMYEFTEPAGVRANLTTIQEDMLDKGVSVKLYNQSGHTRTLKEGDNLSEIEEWLAQ